MKPNFSGVWKADLNRSKLHGPTPKAAFATIEHAEPELAAEMAITRMDETENRLTFRCVTTGAEVINQVQGANMRSRSRWVGEELAIESWINMGGRESHFLDWWSLSPDGQTLTMEHRDDDLAGQITTLERVQQKVE